MNAYAFQLSFFFTIKGGVLPKEFAGPFRAQRTAINGNNCTNSENAEVLNLFH